VFAGRRDDAKLEPLVRRSRHRADRSVARTLRCAKEDEVAAFLNDADNTRRLEVCIFNVGANVNFTDPGDYRPRLPKSLGMACCRLRQEVNRRG